LNKINHNSISNKKQYLIIVYRLTAPVFYNSNFICKNSYNERYIKMLKIAKSIHNFNINYQAPASVI